ncbi:MAG: Rne/Rng family ribonuclease, partial [Actinomycetota bacterium]
MEDIHTAAAARENAEPAAPSAATAPARSAPETKAAGDGTTAQGATGTQQGAAQGTTGAANPNRRRRRRGGRGRGRGGARPANQTGQSGDVVAPEAGEGSGAAVPAAAAKPRQPQQRQSQAAPRTTAKDEREPRTTRAALGDAPASTIEAPPEPAADASETGGGAPAGTGTGASKRRRRRGGRGRGGKKPAGATGAAAEDLGADDEAPAGESVETQRDEAEPDADVGATPSRRRRGGQGSAAKTDQTIEERIAAGGSTRRIRTTRTRTGRDGRRRREPTPTPPRVTDKVMVITEHGERDQIAVLEQDVLVQHYVTRIGATSMVGNIYLGRVQNVLPGMEAAFVDVGRGRNGVLYAGEVNYNPDDVEGPAPRIEQLLKPGQSVMVQVTKDPMGGKGARLTANLSLAGRYLVLAPNQNLQGISRRLPDEARKRLKTLLKRVKPPEHGVIVRTAAEAATEEALETDLRRLLSIWDDIQKRSKRAKAPAGLYEEPELTVRVVRDLFTDEEFKTLATDSRRVYDEVMAYVREVAPDLEPKVQLHDGKLSAFEEHRIVEQIHKALDKKVWLPSGGYLYIERTEAMTIVDVNTGKSVGKTNLEETVVNTNLEAAKEVARQLRLRDIGGIIVIDFIDMLLEKNKKQVEGAMKEALAVDKTRSQVFEIGPLGLMQVTRKRVSGGLVESFSETC